jgi:hypothetical protein
MNDDQNSIVDGVVIGLLMRRAAFPLRSCSARAIAELSIKMG